MPITCNGEIFIEAKEAAGRLCISESTLKKLRYEGKIRYLQSSPRKIFYSESDIMRFLAEGIRDPKPGKQQLNG